MSRSTSNTQHFFIVLAKELRDALRDRRTLMRTLLPMLLIGPLVLVALSFFIGSIEEKAEKRELVVLGLEHAPTLKNYLERQSYSIKTPPADYETELKAGRYTDAVVRVPADFEAQLHAGESPVLQIVSDSSNQRAEIQSRQVDRVLNGFNQERATLALALRGVPGQALKPVSVEDVNLASQQSRGAQITGMIPFIILSAILMGSLTAALDSTAGERERGSLEPLVMNPINPSVLVLGKWAAAGLFGLTVAAAALASFIPAQHFIKSEELQALFQFGLPEALLCFAVLAPLSLMACSLMMAMAMRTTSFKEAQASAGLVVTLLSLLPMVSFLNPSGEQAWYVWVPGLGQFTLMGSIIKGEALQMAKLLPAFGSSIALTALALAHTARSLKAAVAK
ncbi:ABC transporter permease [Roseateles sp. BYS180W]|uniref:ABC transporter permease n=1 Tax=Roseateles rivi TaxID=3299028 RepID=A0ABW7FTX5_9BURK